MPSKPGSNSDLSFSLERTGVERKHFMDALRASIINESAKIRDLDGVIYRTTTLKREAKKRMGEKLEERAKLEGLAKSEKTESERKHCMEAIDACIIEEEMKIYGLVEMVDQLLTRKIEAERMKEGKMKEFHKFEGDAQSIHAPENSNSKADKGLPETTVEVLGGQTEVTPVPINKRHGIAPTRESRTSTHHPKDYKFDFGKYEGKPFMFPPDSYLKGLAGQESVFGG